MKTMQREADLTDWQFSSVDKIEPYSIFILLLQIIPLQIQLSLFPSVFRSFLIQQPYPLFINIISHSPKFLSKIHRTKKHVQILRNQGGTWPCWCIFILFMGKKVRYQYLTGALLQPYFHFINKVEFGINPVSDPRGTRIAQHIFKFANSTRPIFKGEKFQSSLVYDLASNNSWATFTYLNGMRQGFLLKHLNIAEFDLERALIDKVVEFQRACDGFEDEYEDDVKK